MFNQIDLLLPQSGLPIALSAVAKIGPIVLFEGAHRWQVGAGDNCRSILTALKR
jgi:hypothetical protein